jgi:hypothetical protein
MTSPPMGGAGSTRELASNTSQRFRLDPNMGTVGFDGDERIARTLTEQSSDLGLPNFPVHDGKVLNLSI